MTIHSQAPDLNETKSADRRWEQSSFGGSTAACSTPESSIAREVRMAKGRTVGINDQSDNGGEVR